MSHLASFVTEQAVEKPNAHSRSDVLTIAMRVTQPASSTSDAGNWPSSPLSCALQGRFRLSDAFAFDLADTEAGAARGAGMDGAADGTPDPGPW